MRVEGWRGGHEVLCVFLSTSKYVLYATTCFFFSHVRQLSCRMQKRDKYWTLVGQNNITFQLLIASAVDLPPDK